MTFRDYIRVLRERAGVIVACTALVAIGAFAASNLAPSSFTARTEMILLTEPNVSTAFSTPILGSRRQCGYSDA